MPMRSEVAWKYNFGLEVILVEMDYIIVMEGRLVTGKKHLKLKNWTPDIIAYHNTRL